MAIFKCKMCGGTIEFEPGSTIGVCDSCGTRQTLPRLDDDRKTNLYDRANHFRRNNEFDKAAGIYEQILNEDTTDSEAYWSLVLCNYGIEYVEDPATHKRVPTVNRAQFTSIFDDDNYKAAIQHADSYQRAIYEEEAAAINEIQKGILAISQQEKPFDVFICYKETDNNGRRTQDSVLANDLYHQLTQEGFRVFFSRITLEDKLGTAYEPYIFAALNSAKVMVVIGTKPEYFNAVWVKNEWSRYLKLVKTSGGKKMLIPAYKDMDPYDLPEEFSHLQAQDMSKLGFMQDLIRGIKKIVRTEETVPKAGAAASVASAAAVAPLLKRAFMFLEDGEWNKADSFCEQVLNQDPENAQAYLGKLMAELKVRTKEDFRNRATPFDSLNNYQKVVRFADENLSKEMQGYISYINDRNEMERIKDQYNKAHRAMDSAATEAEFKAAAEMFESINQYEDSVSLAEQCLENAEVCRKNGIYEAARKKMSCDSVESYESAIAEFQTITGWKDSDDQIESCHRRIAETKAKEEAERIETERRQEAERLERERQAEMERIRAQKMKKVAAILVPVIIACVALVLLTTKVIIPNSNYRHAMKLMESGQYEEAIAAFEALDGYKDSDEQKEAAAQALLDDKYNNAVSLYKDKEYREAILLFHQLDGSFKDTRAKVAECELEQIKNASVGDYVWFGLTEQDNDESNGKEEIEWIVVAKEGNRALIVSRFALYSTTYEDVKAYISVFLKQGFSADESKYIINAQIPADKNPVYDTDPGQEYKNKIFLLSIPEVNLLSQISETECRPTERAKYTKAGAEMFVTNDGFFRYWLRTPGAATDKASYVDYTGIIYYQGVSVREYCGFRPAMWIELEP